MGPRGDDLGGTPWGRPRWWVFFVGWDARGGARCVTGEGVRSAAASGAELGAGARVRQAGRARHAHERAARLRVGGRSARLEVNSLGHRGERSIPLPRLDRIDIYCLPRGTHAATGALPLSTLCTHARAPRAWNPATPSGARERRQKAHTKNQPPAAHSQSRPRGRSRKGQRSHPTRADGWYRDAPSFLRSASSRNLLTRQ